MCYTIKHFFLLEFSWQVLLKEKNSTTPNDFCKGTLITRQHIVTTAYCVKNREM